MLVIPTLHPAAILRAADDHASQARFEAVVLEDMQKALRLLQSTPTWDEKVIWEKKGDRLWRLFPTADEVVDFCERAARTVHARYVAGDPYGYLSLDVECNKSHSPLDTTLICVGLGFRHADGRRDVICVPNLSKDGVAYWQDPHDRARVGAAVAELLFALSVPKVMHNGAFDSCVMKAFGMPIRNWAADCYLDAETEFLTERGWLKYDEIKTEDQLATLNQHSGRFEFQRFSARVAKQFEGDIYTFETPHSRAVVTGNHRMWCAPKYRSDGRLGAWSFRRAKEMLDAETDTFLVQTSALEARPFPSRVSGGVDFARLLGFWITDGSIGYDGDFPRSLRLSQQYRGRAYKEMNALMKKIGAKRSRSIHREAWRSTPCVEITWRFGGVQEAARFAKLCGRYSKNRRLPQAVFVWEARDRRALLDAMLLGDGSKTHGKMMYRTASKGLAGDFQALALSLGYAVTIHWAGGCWGVTLWNKKTDTLGARLKGGRSPQMNVSKKHVKGRIVCFTVPNETLITRSRGKPAFYGNTMQAHHVLDAELPQGLGFVASRLLDIKYWKDDVKGKGAWLSLDDVTLRSYNLRDILCTSDLCGLLHQRLMKTPRFVELYAEEMELCRIMLRGTLRGIEADVERRDSTQLDAKGNIIGIRPRLAVKRTDALARLGALNGSTFNPQSPGQLQDFLFRRLAFPVVKETPTGQPSTDKDAMVLLALQASNAAQVEGLKALVDFRASAKMLQMVESFPILSDGRLHVQWKLLPVSGRFASSPNAQNWGKQIKRLFRAGYAQKLVGIDLSQAELRMMAYAASDKQLLEMYATGVNVHTVNAALLFRELPALSAAAGHKDLNAVTEAYLFKLLGPVEWARLTISSTWKETRTLAKNFVFGCLDKSTPVALLNGSKPICEVKPGDWTWCWDGQKYVPTRVRRAWKTGEKECLRLTVRDGVGKRKTLILTSNHECVMRDGSLKAAGLLQPGDRLMPFRRTPSNGYNEIDPFNDGSRIYEHRWVLQGHELVHHENENKTDNRPENLIGTTRGHHRRIHGPTEMSEAGRAANSAKAKEQWHQDPKLAEKLTAARVASPKWKQSISAEMQKRRDARDAKPPCSCGKPIKAKGLCAQCYLAEYRRKKNHVVVSIERVGVREVWDLEVEHPAHNFALADVGLFVCNSNYGAEPETLLNVLRAKRDPETGHQLFPHLELDVIEALRVRWLRLHPEIPLWWRMIEKTVPRAGGYSCPISGRTRWYRGGFKKNEMLNFPIQTGVASWVNKCMIDIQRTFDAETGGAAQIISQVHDALTVEGPDEYAKRAGDVMQERINRPFELPGFPAATLPADKADIGVFLDET